jgi:hypothetical protein
MLSTVRSAIITHTRSKNNPACKSAGVKNCTALLLSSKAATAVFIHSPICVYACAQTGGKIASPAAASKHFLPSLRWFIIFTLHCSSGRNNNSSFTCVPRTKSIVLFISTWSLTGYMYVGVPLDLQVQRVGNKAICRRLYHAGNKLQH